MLALALVLGDPAAARFVVEKNSLRVTSPAALRGVYECAIGNFGMPQYGGTMHGVVVYPKANAKACNPFADFDLSFKPKPGGLPVFLLVDRGGQLPPSVLRIYLEERFSFFFPAWHFRNDRR